MKLQQLLNTIEQTAKSNGLSKPYVVGGVPRDKIRREVKQINDVDLTTEKGDALQLAFACAQTIPYDKFQLYDDNHASIRVGDLQIDFSSHFISANIDRELNNLGIKNKTPLIREMYSRDFTINTLLQDLKLEKVFDITHNGIQDIKAGVIRCPIAADTTIKDDPKRIMRALTFALKFEYTIDGELIDAIKKNRHLLKELSQEHLKNKVNELIELNPEKALRMLMELGLLKVIPMTKLISEELIRQKLLYYAFE